VGATFSGLCLVALHGLAEDALYGTWAIPSLFFLPGFVVALEGHGSERVNEAWLPRLAPPRPVSRRSGLLLAAIAVALVALGVGFGRSIVSSIQANLGALVMARQQLTGWPTGSWNDGREVANLRPAEAWFAKALASKADNRSAHYRLGLIDMQRRDFTGAVDHLSLAAQRSPGHRGVTKSLGFALCWAGSLDEAAQQLVVIPEARRELEIYVWWWGTQGRPDLADRAQRLASRLPPS
jgi:tetratricopeptide (TPR) repeat protein